MHNQTLWRSLPGGSCNIIWICYNFTCQSFSWSGRKQPSFQSLLNLLISHNRSKRGIFLNRHIPINSCSFSVDWSINWCKWCRSFYPRSRNATYSLDTLLYSLLKYESRPSNSDCRSSCRITIDVWQFIKKDSGKAKPVLQLSCKK